MQQGLRICWDRSSWIDGFWNFGDDSVCLHVSKKLKEISIFNEKVRLLVLEKNIPGLESLLKPL